MWVDSLGPEVDPENRMEIRYKPEETPITLAAKKSYLGRVYLDWAQYPITETQELSSPEQGYAVHFYDLRYRYPGRSNQPLGAGVILDRDLRVQAEFFGHRVRRPPEESQAIPATSDPIRDALRAQAGRRLTALPSRATIKSSER
jgi:hypothetical protein